jgi:hypothetical protein
MCCLNSCPLLISIIKLSFHLDHQAVVRSNTCVAQGCARYVIDCRFLKRHLVICFSQLALLAIPTSFDIIRQHFRSLSRFSHSLSIKLHSQLINHIPNSPDIFHLEFLETLCISIYTTLNTFHHFHSFNSSSLTLSVYT